ncbi:MAG TPA: Ig-like domain-containing protein, partial [Sphingomonadales bacterium]|nr:Ig-like domain-containing protein [Sphingomonadales bacterium]
QRAVLWSASDDNDDELMYTLYFRAEGESGWRLLKDRLEQKFYSWDANTMPDGAYYLKVVASDADANPPGEGLTAERISDRFEVDNTPPTIGSLTQQAGNPEVRVRFDASDSYSNIARAEYSLNAGEWKVIFPVDRTTDAPKEAFEIVLKDLPPGEHTLTVRVYDQFENSTTEKVVLRGEAQRRR